MEEHKRIPEIPDHIRRENEKKALRYRMLNQAAQKGQIVFTGSSLMEQFPIGELLMSLGIWKVVYNRSFSGYITTELMEVLDDCVLGLEPSKLFINIGTNDLDLIDNPIERLEIHYREILQRIQYRLPECETFMLEYYPVCRDTGSIKVPPGKRIRTKEAVEQGNRVVRKLAREFGCQNINVNHVLQDEEGYLRPELASDYIHMWPTAYMLILEELKHYL